MQGAGGEMVVDDGVVPRAKKARQDPLSSSESDEELFKMFKEWAIKYERNYKTADEEKERFKIWCATKVRIDAINSRQKPGEGILRLQLFADLTDEEQGRYFMRPCFPIPQEIPAIQAESDKKAAEYHKMVEKNEAEEKAAFDKWVAEQNRNYGNEFERKIGFNMYRTNTRWIKSLIEQDPGRYSASPIEMGILLDQALTLDEVKSLLNGGQDAGDLRIGKPLAGQKHDPAAKRFEGEKGKEKMQGAGKKVVGHGATTRSISYVKKSLEGHMATMDFEMFKEWAKENNKEYKTVAELCDSFKIWRSTKEPANAKNSCELKRLA